MTIEEICYIIAVVFLGIMVFSTFIFEFLQYKQKCEQQEKRLEELDLKVAKAACELSEVKENSNKK